VRLADYQPPAFLIDTVDLVFDLAADETRVKSRLGIRRNLAVTQPAAALHPMARRSIWWP
jgi:aminopeptidase N